MRKKLSFIIYSLASGGAERVVSILINELHKEYDVSVVLMNDVIFYTIPKEIKIIYLENSSPTESGIRKLFKLPFLGYKYKKILVENSIDISLSFMNRPNYINAFAKLFGSKIKTIISERIAPSQEYKTDNLKDKISRYLIKFLYPKVGIVVPNSKYMEYELNNIFKITKTQVIYNPVDINEYKVNKQDKFVFIHIGRFEIQKNHKLLIEAFKSLNTDAELWLIGDGYLRDELEKIASKNVKFLGRQKNIFEFLSQADCFVFGSNYEGFPNVLLEALACGLPVVSTDCKSGPREILAPDTDFKNQLKCNIELARYGVLTPIRDVVSMTKAMNLMVKDEILRKSYRKKATIRANDFNVKEIINIWKKVIDN